MKIRNVQGSGQETKQLFPSSALPMRLDEGNRIWSWVVRHQVGEVNYQVLWCKCKLRFDYGIQVKRNTWRNWRKLGLENLRDWKLSCQRADLVGVWGVAEGGHRKLRTQVGVFNVQNSGVGPGLIGQDQSLNWEKSHSLTFKKISEKCKLSDENW